MNNVAELKIENPPTYCDLDEITQAVDRARAIADLLYAAAEGSDDGNRLQGLMKHTTLNALLAIIHEMGAIDGQLAGKHVKGIGYRWAAED